MRHTGYDFFKAVCKEKGITCKSAGGKSNLKTWLENEKEDTVVAIADGAAYIDSQRYFSWERFFTATLTEATKGTYMHYSKSNLNRNYLFDKCKKAILEAIKGVEF